MQNFATESGKSKGEFYTPAEVSRVIAKVIEIKYASSSSQTLHDPACGSGSLLIRAADEAPVKVTIYGQEKDVPTAGLAKMNLALMRSIQPFSIILPIASPNWPSESLQQS